ncbi:MAG: 2-amino-4-hydroxy-6-hydroxymethyldihydropteridine diphosphokinase [Proteobacteria bacterium]|nr:MAG: 2-amino-4-hydroxy-6-hydroxymethyldihydropteridine diphosphokinase [Pseudomonadota bacterium]
MNALQNKNTQVFVDIGSNIDREVNICACVKQLRSDFPDIRFSKAYESKAEGFDGDDFINMSAGFSTDLAFEDLLAYLKALEEKQNRVRDGLKFASRTLDVDILLFGDAVLKPERDVPRAEILNYPFVLFPLAEIAAAVVHPELGKTIGEIAAESELDKMGIRRVELGCLGGAGLNYYGSGYR